MNAKTPHSADQFGKQRDFWWNRDFFTLLSDRVGLNGKKTVADIGCGMGHWSSLVLSSLEPGSTLVGVDKEPEWVAAAGNAIKQRLDRPDDYHLEFCLADALNLPFEDNRFDIVTCQTLLMHLPSAKRGLEEMLRITKPGGLLLCVEPDNFPNYIAYDSLTESRSVEELVEEFRFWLCVHRGRIAAGEGNDSTGCLLAGIFTELGLTDIQVCLSDKATPVIPPYTSPSNKASLMQLTEWYETKTGLYDFEKLGRLASLVNSDEEWIKRRLIRLNESFSNLLSAVNVQSYHTSGGGLLFIVWGSKPPVSILKD